MTSLDIRSARPDQLVSGEKSQWEIIVGLEVHAQVTSNAKLFSGASAAYGGDPNAHVSLVDAAMPGMLPVINKFCVEQAIRTGLGLNAEIHRVSRFDRKNYFYPDLPQGYQISQFAMPIVGEGEIEVEPDGEEPLTIRIERLHLEQDAGKSIHDLSPSETYVDLNRSGVALMEIVSRPDMRSSKEAAAYFNKLRAIVRALGTCDGNMEEGSMRADVNVSVRKAGTKEWGTRCEIKNVNSTRFMMQAIEYEARRQIEILESGGTIDQETRLFDANTGETRTMRSKEDAHDYRYFPDPDLLPLVLEEKWIEDIRKSLPELPDAKKKRFMSEYGLSAYDARVLSSDMDAATYFETVAKGRDSKAAANWVTQELAGVLNKKGLELADSPVKADALGALLDLIKDGTINGKIAKEVFAKMVETGEAPGAIVEREGLKQVTDTGAIEKAIDDLIAGNPDKLEDVKKNPKAFGWWVGQTMKATGGKANPGVVNEILKKKLGV
ncbi:Asp-tRNA(Asn)/Glu-tRNA(Gln) amidotransferase subunit GatB [Vitreimonas flagellata]|uniref:Asp-tRNA(Asn)/Glu-tRNA(Gln) amidotransferase subunit GatB n=1 Tax=Vitreimonas flagellata TaxID=2560861 RepID=UPI0010752D22|nr:Asp-tRNA(Asn)/Glu-tRNA(Gln) amidotransferase subunit GatB [Vitreimonas flagellata]